MTSPLVAAAVDYLTRGLAIIALTGKTPNVTVHRRGLHDAISGAPEDEGDLDLIRSLFEHPDTTGIGILTTFPLIVVDVDSEVGAVNLEQLVGDEVFTARWVAKTRKGLHLYFATTVPTGTFKLFGVDGGVDLKGEGGYVAAPPSAHPDGGSYTWLRYRPDETLVEAPAGVIEKIEQHAADLDRVEKQAEYKRGVFRARNIEYGTQPDFSGIMEAMGKAEEGNRNAMLHWAARSMADDGAGDSDFEALADLAVKIGLTPVETKRTIRSARRG